MTDKDWQSLPGDLPVPEDDGAADHLEQMALPDIALPATHGTAVNLSCLAGLTVVYAYPRTGVPGEASLVADWDLIPGARGCTPQSCAFRDHHGALQALGAQVFGLSAQNTAYQRELAERLHLPFEILSDHKLALAGALNLPCFEVAGETLLKRLTMIIRDGRIGKVFYPVFPPDHDASNVTAYLTQLR